jgi:YjbE family integral membrane protein
MTDVITSDAVTTFVQVVMIDLVLAGDNAVVIALAAAGLPADQRRRAITIGIITATVLRIACAGLATQLLQILGLVLAGGLLLLWVCWKMWRELHTVPPDQREWDGSLAGVTGRSLGRKTFGQATLRIIAADISMSLDNVLAIAGAAREHPFVLGFGLLLSIALMGIAADLIGRLLQKHRWIAYLGLAIVLYVACEMIYRGTLELMRVNGFIPND